MCPPNAHTIICRLWHFHKLNVTQVLSQHTSFCCRVAVKTCTMWPSSCFWSHLRTQPSTRSALCFLSDRDLTGVRRGVVCLCVTLKRDSIVQSDALLFEEARWFPVSESHAGNNVAAGRQTRLVQPDATQLATWYSHATRHPHIQYVYILSDPLNEIMLPEYKRFNRI